MKEYYWLNSKWALAHFFLGALKYVK